MGSHKVISEIISKLSRAVPPQRKRSSIMGDIPFVKPPELLGGVISKAEDNLSDEGAGVARILPPKSVLVSCIGNLGKVGLNTIPVAFNQQINAIIPDEKAIPDFLFYQVLSPAFIDQIHKLAGGTTVPIVNKTKFNSINMLLPSLPSLPEQKRIVAILDKAFEGINQAVANAEKNLANARELFESYLNNVFTQKGEGWIEKKLTDILNVQPRNGWSPPAKNHSDTGTPVLTLSSVTGFNFDLSKIKYTSASTKKDAHYWIENGALLITKSNTPKLVGHVAISFGIKEPTIYPDLIMKMILNSDIALTKFVYYQLRSVTLRALIMNNATGANPP